MASYENIEGASDSLKARNWRIEFDNYVDSSTDFRNRLLRNFDFYDGIDNGQWEDAVIQALADEGKPAHTFNWTQNMVDTIIGHIKQEPFGINYLQKGKGLKQQGDVLQSLYEMDYERGDYQKNFDEMIRNGIILQGVLQFTWDTDDDRLGNVGIVAKNPKHIIVDPYWNSDKIDDCRAIFSYSWLTADQIKSVYDTKSEMVDQAIQMYEFDTQENNTSNADRTQPYYDEDGNLFKVVEVLYIEDRKIRKVIDTGDNSYAPFDLSQYEKHTDEVLQTIINLENPDWKLIYEDMKAVRIFTFCPAIDQDLVLENGDYPLQLGRLPFVFFYFKDNYEKKYGLVDKLIDPQVIFNKRQSLVSHALGGAAGAGNFFFEKSVFGGDQDRVADFEERISMNGQGIEVNDDSLKDKRIQPIERPQMPLDVLKSTEDQRNYLNDLSMITPGMMGYAEKADESGALYQSKVRQAMIGLESLSDSIKYKLKEIGEMYIEACKQIYSGPSRKFVDHATNQEFWINRIMVDEEGNVIPMNYIENLPSYLVKITEKRIGKSRRDEEIQKQVSLLQYVKNPALSAALEGQISKNLELGDEAEAVLTQASNEWLGLQLEQIKFQKAQIVMQTKQMAQPPAPAQPQQGAPQQGAPAKPQQSPSQMLKM